MAIEKAYFVGDVHLDPRLPKREMAFHRFLDLVASDRPDHLFLLGDIFEFWFGYRTVMFSQPLPTIAKLFELRNRGIEMTYIVGNHDFHPGPVFENILGVTVAHDPIVVEIGASRVYLSHGDEINSRDRGYRILKRILRNPVAQFLFRGIPASLAWYIGRTTSDTSRRYTDREKEGIPDEIYTRFLSDRRAEGVDVIIHGHTHQPGRWEKETAHGRIQLINSGHWFGPGHYVKFEEGGFSLETFDI